MPYTPEEFERSLKGVRKGLLQLGTLVLALCGVLWAEIFVLRIRGSFPDGGLLCLASAVAISYSYHLWFLSHLSLLEWRRKADFALGEGAGWAFLELDPRFARRSLILLYLPPLSLFANFLNAFLRSPLSAYTSLVGGALLLTEGLLLGSLLKKF